MTLNIMPGLYPFAFLPVAGILSLPIESIAARNMYDSCFSMLYHCAHIDIYSCRLGNQSIPIYTIDGKYTACK